MTALRKEKITIIGDERVGKTQIVSRFTLDKFDSSYQSTTGIDFMSKIVQEDQVSLKLQLWDASGQMRFLSLVSSYLKDASLVMIVFDVTNRKSFDNLGLWIECVKKSAAKDKKIVLVANKIDRDSRLVTTEEAQEFANQHDMAYKEVSALTGVGVKSLFTDTIMPFLPVVRQADDNGQKKAPIRKTRLRSEDSQYQQAHDDIDQLERTYLNNKDVQAIVAKLREGLLTDDPKTFFDREFDQKQSGPTMRTHLNNLAYCFWSGLNTVVNVVVAVLQKVYAALHALAFCMGLVSQQRTSYPGFFAFGQKQHAQKVCDDVYANVCVSIY